MQTIIICAKLLRIVTYKNLLRDPTWTLFAYLPFVELTLVVKESYYLTQNVML